MRTSNFHWQRLLLLVSLAFTLFSPARAQDGVSRDEGLWGTVKDKVVEPIVLRPAREALGPRYRALPDQGRFVVGACAGFGASRIAVGGERRRGYAASCVAPQITSTRSRRLLTSPVSSFVQGTVKGKWGGSTKKSLPRLLL